MAQRAEYHLFQDELLPATSDDDNPFPPYSDIHPSVIFCCALISAILSITAIAGACYMIIIAVNYKDNFDSLFFGVGCGFLYGFGIAFCYIVGTVIRSRYKICRSRNVLAIILSLLVSLVGVVFFGIYGVPVSYKKKQTHQTIFHIVIRNIL